MCQKKNCINKASLPLNLCRLLSTYFKRSNLMDRTILWAVSFTLYKLASKNLHLIRWSWPYFSSWSLKGNLIFFLISSPRDGQIRITNNKLKSHSWEKKSHNNASQKEYIAGPSLDCWVLIVPMALYYLLLFIIIYIWDGEMLPCSHIFIFQVLSLKM